MRHRAPPVEQAGHSVRKQRAAGNWPGNHLRFLDELGRHDVDQILRDAPDRRRRLEQLVRVEIEPAVEAVAVVEVALHHHLEPAHVFERAGADLFVTGVHELSLSLRRSYTLMPAAGFEYATFPPTMVAATPPLNDQP